MTWAIIFFYIHILFLKNLLEDFIKKCDDLQITSLHFEYALIPWSDFKKNEYSNRFHLWFAGYMYKKIYKYLVILAVNFILIFSPRRKVDWYVVWYGRQRMLVIQAEDRKGERRLCILFLSTVWWLWEARGGLLFLSKTMSSSRVGRGLHFFLICRRER